MAWTIELTEKAIKTIASIDRVQAAKIKRFLAIELPAMDSPRQTGKALQGDLKGLWRYRVGDYRLIAKIKDGELLILVVEVGHRKDIYK